MLQFVEETAVLRKANYTKKFNSFYRSVITLSGGNNTKVRINTPNALEKLQLDLKKLSGRRRLENIH